jgi:hypothetical protein
MQALALTTQTESLLRKTHQLLDSIEEADVPPAVMFAAAELHAVLAGPGPDALDLRPKSLEVVGDAGLHAKAVAEAKARLQASIADQAKVIAHLPSSTLHAAADYDARTMAHREDVAQAWRDGRESRELDEGLWWHSATLGMVLRRWWQAR